jgi:DNA-binding NtrC family response regulator
MTCAREHVEQEPLEGRNRGHAPHITPRCLLLSTDPAACNGNQGLRSRIRRSLGIDVASYPLAGCPERAPSFDFSLLHLADHESLAELDSSLAEPAKFGGLPLLAICEAPLARWAPTIARSGMPDFLFDPFTDEELGARVQRALERVAPTGPTGAAMTPADRMARNLVGNSPAFVAQIERLSRYSACEATVLILGETGTGKEIFARALHYTSARAAAPWVAVNCGAIPGDLVEDELFGHVRGAYTTAHGQRDGLVKEAAGGTLFLDDIDCLPLAAQSKLLRLLQEREYRPVGSNAVVRADVRVVAASNRQLAVLAERGQFRQDLFFRLDVLPLVLPPLRERREDIGTLALHFMRHVARELGQPAGALTPGAMKRLLSYDWPGNVRELKHVIERAMVLARTPMLDAADIDCGRHGTQPFADATFRDMKSRVVEDFERGYIAQLLSASEGNVTHAAHAAGKNRRAFFELMRKYRIDAETFRPARV